MQGSYDRAADDDDLAGKQFVVPYMQLLQGRWTKTSPTDFTKTDCTLLSISLLLLLSYCMNHQVFLQQETGIYLH